MNATSSDPYALILHEAIEDLYKIFAPYPFNPNMPHCPCCVSAEDNRQLHRCPLRELTPQDLTHFAINTILTWGTVEDFKHFLPRLLECMTTMNRAGFIDHEIILSRLTHGDWQTWPQAEQSAVRRFLAAYWRQVLSSPPEEKDTIECLCAIAQAEDHLQTYFAIWTEHPALMARVHLARLINSEGHMILRKGKISNAFWESRHAQRDQVIAWLRTPTVHQCLEEAFFQHLPSTADGRSGPQRKTGHPDALADTLSAALTIQELLFAQTQNRRTKVS